MAKHSLVDRMPKAGECWRQGLDQHLYEIVGTGRDAESGGAVVIYRRQQVGSPTPTLVLPIGVFLGMNRDGFGRFTFECDAPKGSA